MEKKNTGLIVLIIILSILILALGGYIVYDKALDKTEIKADNNDTYEENNIAYNYDNIKGLYSARKTFNIDGNDENGRFTLYLWENGLFKYEHSIFAPTGYIGNYIMKENKIILNCIYETNSGVGLFLIKDTQKLEIDINDDGSLMLKDVSYQGGSKDNISIILNKESKTKEEQYLEVYDYNNIISQPVIVR